MCPKSPKPVVNRPAYNADQIDQNIKVEEDVDKGSLVGSPGKQARDVDVSPVSSGVAVRSR